MILAFSNNSSQLIAAFLKIVHYLHLVQYFIRTALQGERGQTLLLSECVQNPQLLLLFCCCCCLCVCVICLFVVGFFFWGGQPEQAMSHNYGTLPCPCHLLIQSSRKRDSGFTRRFRLGRKPCTKTLH